MRKLLLAAGLVCVFATPAWSGEYLDWGNWLSSGNAVKPGTPKAFRTNIAAGAGAAPEYLGGDQYELKPLLLADVEYRGEFFLSTQRGLGWAFYKKGNIRFGPRLTVDYGRDSGGSDALEGLPDIDPAIEVGLFGELYNGPLRLQLSVAQDIGTGHEGFLASADAAYGGRFGQNASLIIGANVAYMSDSYAESFFGVADDRTRPGRDAFTAAAGVRDVGGYVQIIYDVTRNVYVAFDARANLLLGDAADSPLSESDTQFFGGAMLGYRF